MTAVSHNDSPQNNESLRISIHGFSHTACKVLRFEQLKNPKLALAFIEFTFQQKSKTVNIESCIAI